ncbi:MAG: molybdopterin-binding protein [Myxococcota bacterium]
MPRASAIIIGNEILNGKVQDANTQTLARVLFECGVALKCVETIPDHTETIVETVRKHSATYDLVFTSGGIGPTHDDITYDGVAKAFGQNLALHAETVRRYREFHGKEPNEARKRMALLPENAEVFFNDGLWVPTVYLRPVYVLAGIPELFTQMLEGIRHRFTYQSFERALIYTDRLEGDIAAELEQVQQQFSDVEIGSYPQKPGSDHRVMLSVEGANAEHVRQAADLIEKFV